jgi:hypothetical protein
MISAPCHQIAKLIPLSLPDETTLIPGFFNMELVSRQRSITLGAPALVTRRKAASRAGEVRAK